MASDALDQFSIGYFDPHAPLAQLSGNLPHWRQAGATYFVTFRLADSLPAGKLREWKSERESWMRRHPEPHDEAARRDYYQRFPERFQKWLDAGSGSCVLAIAEVEATVERALRHFDGRRYDLDEHFVAANHVHALLTPRDAFALSEILHSWKSFTSHRILAMELAHQRLGRTRVWQKESFDHIVRDHRSLDRIRQYIRAHGRLARGAPSPPEAAGRRFYSW